MATTDEFVRLVKCLDRFAEHPLHPDAIDRVYNTYLTAGLDEARISVGIIRAAFLDIEQDSYGIWAGL